MEKLIVKWGLMFIYCSTFHDITDNFGTRNTISEKAKNQQHI